MCLKVLSEQVGVSWSYSLRSEIILKILWEVGTGCKYVTFSEKSKQIKNNFLFCFFAKTYFQGSVLPLKQPMKSQAPKTNRGSTFKTWPEKKKKKKIALKYARL